MFRPRKVGLLKPNDFGLFDMLGNESQHCQPETVRSDFTGEIELNAVLRGGGYQTSAEVLGELCVDGWRQVESRSILNSFTGG